MGATSLLTMTNILILTTYASNKMLLELRELSKTSTRFCADFPMAHPKRKATHKQPHYCPIR